MQNRQNTPIRTYAGPNYYELKRTTFHPKERQYCLDVPKEKWRRIIDYLALNPWAVPGEKIIASNLRPTPEVSNLIYEVHYQVTGSTRYHGSGCGDCWVSLRNDLVYSWNIYRAHFEWNRDNFYKEQPDPAPVEAVAPEPEEPKKKTRRRKDGE